MNYLEDSIRNLYSRLNIVTPTELTVENIADQLNIEIMYWDEPSQAFSNDDVIFIFLNRSLVQSEEFCHELGHVLLHAGDQMYMDPLFVEYQEIKANNFALHAAVPTTMLMELNLPSNYFEAVSVIQDTFSVSPEFACRRLNHFINNHLHTLTNAQKAV
ncbi:hypothetical protein KZO01_06020 [Kurthia zopfii]|uniref:Domain of uncharacterized function (DUF955) n=1 Tax=Kurthia zopfii TaxID=1650 RepID=A0A8B4Q5N3_9BACL|nr:ImmA/IrrE family metallo-endopeptidase [Kurthia zopfii]PWI23528.1 hypothetical protein DF281_03005 [Kurthia zopfii]TDR35556.1 uncharacterized protein DUF955 [Kurthia zopfii]GEK30293.1 hypothetical protein KZO01_06020 [Kurthia zopfii]STX09182.1 Domain of uncharacterised function (DUF955) [Kurthia zopfii]